MLNPNYVIGFQNAQREAVPVLSRLEGPVPSCPYRWSIVDAAEDPAETRMLQNENTHGPSPENNNDSTSASRLGPRRAGIQFCRLRLARSFRPRPDCAHPIYVAGNHPLPGLKSWPVQRRDCHGHLTAAPRILRLSRCISLQPVKESL
jgi:hypothetical protein